MSDRLYIQLDYGYLDVSEKFPCPIDLSVADIRKIEKKNSAKSRSVKLPGTQNNINLFGQLADVNSDFSYYNPNFKTNMKLIKNTVVILDGYLKLVSIDKKFNADLQGDEVFFNVELNAKTADFISEIGDTELTALDFSEFDHILTRDTVVTSWTHSNSDGYYYFNAWNGTDLYEIKDFRPAIYYIQYLTKMFDYAGFSVGGPFLENETFIKEIIPFNGDAPRVKEDELNRRLFQASGTATYSVYGATMMGGLDAQNDFGFPTIKSDVNTGYIDARYDDDSTSPNFDPNNHWNTSTNEYKIDAIGSYNVDVSLSLDIEFKTFRDDISLISGTSSYIHITFPTPHYFTTGTNLTVELKNTTNYDGIYTSIIVVNPNVVRIDGITLSPDEFSGTFCWEAYEQTYQVNSFLQPYETNHQNNDPFHLSSNFRILKNTSSVGDDTNYNIQMPLGTGPFPNNAPITPTFDTNNNYTDTKNINHHIIRTGLNLIPNDVISMDYRIFADGNLANLNIKYTDKENSYSKNVPIIITVKQTPSVTVVKNSTNGTVIGQGDVIEMNSFIPEKIKMKTPIDDLKNRYNLFFTIDPDNDKKIILTERVNYYTTDTADALDWTQKKHYDKDKIELLSELQNKEMKFTYKKDTDDWNKNYTESTGGEKEGDIYGQETIIFDNEFTLGEKKIETPFSPTPLIYNSVNSTMIVPALKTFEPKANIRVLLANGVKDTLDNKTWTFQYVSGGNPSYQETFSEYSFAGHYDDVIAPTQDINFGEIPYHYYSSTGATGSSIGTTTNTLYNTYWSDYVQQIAEGKLVTSYFDLNEVDIGFLKDNFNVKIFIKDSYYYLNKISGFDPTNNKPTLVELIKIVDGVTFIPSKKKVTKDIRTDWEIADEIRKPYTSRKNGNNDNTSDTLIGTGEGNYIGTNTKAVISNGSNNYIADGVVNSGILGGNDCFIPSRITNSWIIGSDDRTITQDNEIWLGDIHIINGVVESNINLIQGPQNGLLNLFSESVINRVRGPVDGLRNIPTGDSLVTLIRGPIY